MNKDKFLEENQISNEKLESCSISWDELLDIYNDYRSNLSQIKSAAISLTEQIIEIDKVHSIKYRIKDPEHLLEKIIRKNSENNDYLVTKDNYLKQVTDLIGIRVLHLYKEDWSSIHKGIDLIWNFHETPTANIRKGDNAALIDNYKDYGLKVNVNTLGYRSVHYLIKTKLLKSDLIAEIQVRTIFEEGWSEIDHLVRYQYNTSNDILNQYLEVFNRISGAADEMASLLLSIDKELQVHDAIKKEKIDLENELKNK